ncbi:uncharacterized protein LOC105647198 isoform X2 [Jatropha curcas]|uniref:uncharacterized protein LOC105647198 isoform X2 n=1 Tax=Jatropha curcas TaxID=180498 RepID=UPI0005FBBF60|nr:uncharacterized protein LOC105647198 isoform X2 [Jatropha curcas]
MGEELFQKGDNSTPPLYYNSSVHNSTATASDIESAAQNAVMREQEIETQRVIQGQREAVGAGAPPKDDTDIFSEKLNPSALKEHILKMTTEHRAEIALKRGKPVIADEGHVDIGNGYGVPGGGAYYSSSRSELDRGSEKKPATKELPEYLKQKLRVRGILKDDMGKDHPLEDNNGLDSGLAQPVNIRKLPSGWVEAKDPDSGALYYYNQSTGKSQWEMPVETSLIPQVPSPLPLLEDWVEALDETTGHKYYYNTKTHASQWEHPNSSEVASQQFSNTANPRNHIWDDQSFELMKCMGCGGWGAGLVQAWGYCNHCTRTTAQPLIGVTSSRPAVLEISEEILTKWLQSKGPTGNLPWAKEIEERAENVLILKMMNWILWTQVLIQMLPVVAGLLA